MQKGKKLLTNSIVIFKNTGFYPKFKSFEKVTKRVPQQPKTLMKTFVDVFFG
jgi:predicted nucleic acid-binding Zn ribbon protein